MIKKWLFGVVLVWRRSSDRIFSKILVASQFTVNGDRYREMIRDFITPDLRENDMEGHWFQQNDATCHTVRKTMNLLKEFFGNRIISQNGNFDWPLLSLDLTPPNLFCGDILSPKCIATY